MDPLLKAILNLLRCPVCGGQIEGVSKFYCATNRDHYNVRFGSDTAPYIIASEKVIILDSPRQYEIIQNANSTTIYVWKVNGDNIRIIDKVNPPNPLSFDKKLFNFAQINRERLLNKLKTIIVFS